MSINLATFVKDTCLAVGNDSSRLMDVAESVQARFGHVSAEAIDLIAAQLKVPRVEVEGLVTFYAFLSKQPKGKVIVRVCNDVVDMMNGGADVAASFEKEFGIRIGQTTADGRISLEYAPCIGMSDQAPAAMVNATILTNLDAGKAKVVAQAILKEGPAAKLVRVIWATETTGTISSGPW